MAVTEIIINKWVDIVAYSAKRIIYLSYKYPKNVADAVSATFFGLFLLRYIMRFSSCMWLPVMIETICQVFDISFTLTWDRKTKSSYELKSNTIEREIILAYLTKINFTSFIINSSKVLLVLIPQSLLCSLHHGGCTYSLIP